MRRTLALLLALPSAGCAYFNSMWTAERHAKDARLSERRGQISEARSQWALAAAKAERVVIRHPRSRWADDALTLQAEGLARSGGCEEAAAAIARVRASVKNQALRERAELADAECALAASHPVQAAAALTLPLASKDDARRSRAEYFAGRAAALRLDHAAAVIHFERSKQPEALAARAHALLAAGRSAEAAAVLEALIAPQFETERADLLAQMASAGGAEVASASLDRLLARGKRILFQEQARLLIADADRRLAHADYDEAAARYRRAALVAPAATNEAGMASVGQQRVLIARAMQRSDLKPIEAELARLSAEPGVATAKPLLDLVRRAMRMGETPGASFRAAELARDSLGAPALAGQLFVEVAARDTASLYAPKALLAAIPMLPERRDSIAAILDTRYAASPYTHAFHGEPSVAYAAAEDSLARELGVQIVRSSPAPVGARFQRPVPGPRGPQLDEAQATPAAAARSAPRRPGDRPPPAPARDRPTAPERP
ncbi:MAG TPA: hypothetical protein VK573_11800 [Gemmatimonadales bacterium]|nr:hypothetical protein [Gemmatimonadales bacterium]